MANIALNQDPLDELLLVAPAAPDRLPAMLFLAALVHGILIIGVTFNAALGKPFADAISLEVTIVADPDQQYRSAGRSRLPGAGQPERRRQHADQVRPAAPLQSAMPVDNLGHEDGTGLIDATRTSAQPMKCSRPTTTAHHRVTLEPTVRHRNPSIAQAIAMEAGSEMITLPLPQEDRPSTADSRRSAATADHQCRHARVRCCRCISTTGNAASKLSAPPTCRSSATSACISRQPDADCQHRASGDLSDAVIRKTSGSTVLDLAALDILQRASPFNPFPPEIAAEYDTVRFEYKWLFAEQLVSDASYPD